MLPEKFTLYWLVAVFRKRRNTRKRRKREEDKQPCGTARNIEAHPAYVKALAERDVYEKLYKDLLREVRVNL